jgi:hypothetical protein
MNMTRLGKSFAAYRCDLIRLPLKFLIALLFMALPLLVGGQTLQTFCSFNNTNGAAPYAGLTLGNEEEGSDRSFVHSAPCFAETEVIDYP